MKSISTLLLLAVVGGGGWFGYTTLLMEDAVDGFVTKALDRGDIIRTVAATGTIEPVVKVIVGSEVSGKIKKWYADFNAEVKAGEVLAEIDPSRFQTVYDQAEAELAIAKARADELEVRYQDAQRERKRIEALFQQNSSSENEFLVEQAEEKAALAAWRGAQGSILSSEATLNSAKVDLERTNIRSPIDGVVISRQVEDGATVAASLQAPELYVIANNLKQMQVNANVSESDIGMLKEGKPANFTVDAYPKRTFSGTISQIRYAALDVDGVVTYVTVIEVLNDDLALRPGMTANVTFEVARANDVVRIPNASLRFNPNPPDPTSGRPPSRPSGPRKPTVYELVNGEAVQREVDIGLSDGMMTELKGGEVKEGTTVVVDRILGSAGDRPVDITRNFRPG
jgi:HlyD family secretion protein